MVKYYHYGVDLNYLWWMMEDSLEQAVGIICSSFGRI